jgi:ATP-dependent exoDNAse (exonuclease V) alpha subunit
MSDFGHLPSSRPVSRGPTKRKEEKGLDGVGAIKKLRADLEVAEARAERDGLASPQLNEEQLRVVELVQKKESVFVTGGAGTGKSFLLASLIMAARQGGREVAVTATTGTEQVTIIIVFFFRLKKVS